MTAPTGTITFDQPDGGYAWGAAVTATVTGQSLNTDATTRTVEVVIKDPATAEEIDISGTFVTQKPSPLEAEVMSSDNPDPWLAGDASQAGADFTAVFTSTAG